MPISKYYKGSGEKVAAEMKKKYKDRWQEVFYATAKKTGMEPSSNTKKKHGVK